MKTLETEGFTVLAGGGVEAPQGFTAAGLHAGIKKKRKDMGLLVSAVPAAAAGVFTTSQVRAACVTQNEAQLLETELLQAIVVNSGNANACTGLQGLQDCHAMRALTARALHVPDHLVAVASTGVIGVTLPMDRVAAGIHALAATVAEAGEVTADVAVSMANVAPAEVDETGGQAFAKAILTTDTCTKEVAVQVVIDGQVVTIGGVAKGSGMIHPQMATMLAFVTTDAAVEPHALQALLRYVTDRTYNCITVDGDTSTNDMVLVLANGLAGNELLHAAHPQWDAFATAFRYVSEHLAKQIARDGEGATKLIEVHVQGAATEPQALAIAKSVIGSSLVKTAVYGADANWGRILAAAGYSGATFDPLLVDIWLGPVQVAAGGMGVPFDEEAAKEYLLGDPVVITVDLHGGDRTAKAYGCDLTYDYVRINASYRT